MSDLIVKKDPKSATSEAYRTLRTNIQFASIDKELKSILITSPGPEEGKSTTAANLAITISQIGKKVLLMDCDMRKPSIHKIFDVDNTKGLMNILIHDLSLEEAIVRYTSKLDILPTGKIPPNPSEVLSAQRMAELIKNINLIYDFIIIDCPPVIPVTDAQILSTKVEGVLLVINSSVSAIEDCKKAMSLLKSVNANIIGAVLNNVKKKKGSYYNYYGKSDKSASR